nr:hypothetical protein [Tanacetum cinerariifolium]
KQFPSTLESPRASWKAAPKYPGKQFPSTLESPRASWKAAPKYPGKQFPSTLESPRASWKAAPKALYGRRYSAVDTAAQTRRYPGIRVPSTLEDGPQVPWKAIVDCPGRHRAVGGGDDVGGRRAYLGYRGGAGPGPKKRRRAYEKRASAANRRHSATAPPAEGARCRNTAQPSHILMTAAWRLPEQPCRYLPRSRGVRSSSRRPLWCTAKAAHHPGSARRGSTPEKEPEKRLLHPRKAAGAQITQSRHGEEQLEGKSGASSRGPPHRVYLSGRAFPSGEPHALHWVCWGTRTFTLKKLECSKQAFARIRIAAKLPSAGLWLNASKSESMPERGDFRLHQSDTNRPLAQNLTRPALAVSLKLRLFAGVLQLYSAQD